MPGGQTWSVESIDADGVYFNGVGPATDWNVFIYADSGGLPGTQVYSTLNQPVTVSGTTFTVNLSPAACLAEGTYWIEIQANMTFGTQGEWGWTDRTVQSNSPAAWQNPGGGFAICPSWTNKLTCIPTAGGPDQVYRINGTTGSCGGGTPTPTPTGTPAGCSDYTTSTGSGTITPGDTDTGNHCDDCATLISFPFPVSVYGQTFNSANVASNGSLDLIGTETPFTHGCQVLPSSNWEMAIFPYQDDLRTDNLGFAGCSGFPGGNCGIFTSVTGTAPNRQFNIEWRATHFADTTTSANFSVVFYENSSSFFDIFYGATSDNGLDETSGVQASATGPATTFSCGTATLTSGLKVTYNCAGGGASPTPTPTGTPGGCTINGSIDTGDPTQTDRLFRSGIPQTCPATTTCATFGDGLPRHYDSYTFTNTTGATQCVTIDTNTACTGTNFIFTGAYLGSFDPANICTNWIGDSGFSPNPDQPFQVNVDDGQTFVVVVSEVTPDAGCPGYTLTISPETICGGGGTPTPTPTASPGGSCPPTITESTSQTIVSGNSVACNNGIGTTENHYWRAFNMSTFTGGQEYDVVSVSFGIELAQSGTGTGQPLTVNLYANHGAPFPGGDWQSNMIATSGSINIPDQMLTIFTQPISATVSTGTLELVMEVMTPDGTAVGNLFFVGSNADPETGLSYLSAAACGINDPTSTGDLGFPEHAHCV